VTNAATRISDTGAAAWVVGETNDTDTVGIAVAAGGRDPVSLWALAVDDKSTRRETATRPDAYVFMRCMDTGRVDATKGVTSTRRI